MHDVKKRHTLLLSGGHVIPEAEMTAPAVGGMEKVGGGYITPVAVMAHTVGGRGGWVLAALAVVDTVLALIALAALETGLPRWHWRWLHISYNSSPISANLPTRESKENLDNVSFTLRR